MARALTAPATPQSAAQGVAYRNAAVELAELAAASGWLERRAFIESERVWTYRELYDAVASSSGLLAERGVAQGDRVLIALHDRVAFLLAFLGVARLGATAVPINPRLVPEEFEYIAHDAAPSLVVCEPELAPAFPGTPAVSGAELEAAGLSRSPAEPADPGDGAALYGLYTSGTTGRPKLVLHRHSDIRWHSAAVSRAALGIVPDDVLYSVSRAFFSYGLGNTVFTTLSSGATAVLEPGRPTVASVSALACRTHPTVFFAVPSFYAMLLADGDPGCFRSLRVAVSAGEVMSPALCARVSDFLGVPVLDALGSSEVGHLFIANTLERQRPGTCGVVLPGYEISVRDAQGEDLPPGSVGSLWVRGPTLMTGYHGRPEETERVLVGGWLHTGDRAYVDDDGFVHHKGRADDIEMVGGISVSPVEVETVLASHPHVGEVAVAAVPDHLGATRLRAFVVPGAGVSGSEALEAEIILLARRHLAPYKVPRSVQFVDELPRTSTGKLRRHVLRSLGARAGPDRSTA